MQGTTWYNTTARWTDTSDLPVTDNSYAGEFCSYKYIYKWYVPTVWWCVVIHKYKNFIYEVWWKRSFSYIQCIYSNGSQCGYSVLMEWLSWWKLVLHIHVCDISQENVFGSVMYI